MTPADGGRLSGLVSGFPGHDECMRVLDPRVRAANAIRVHFHVFEFEALVHYGTVTGQVQGRVMHQEALPGA